MAIIRIRQGAERPPADSDTPGGVVESLRDHLRTQAERLPVGHRDRALLLGQYRGLGQELKHGLHFINLIAALGGMEITPEQAQLMQARLDARRRAASVDPERRIAAGQGDAIAAMPHDHNHPALKIGALLVEGLVIENSPATRWAAEAVLAVRMELANSTPVAVESAAA